MDAIIVGTGVSALLLAQSLVARGCCERLRVIGPSRPLRPHVLSYWSDVPTPFDDHTIATWSTVSVVSSRGQQVRAPLRRFTYRSFRAQAWADQVMAHLSTHSAVELIDAAVDAVEDDPRRPAVRIGERRLDADWVFDSHGPPIASPSAWQRFVGWEVELDEVSLDLQSATLLDFRTPSPVDFRFVYALPFEARRLFVEHVSYQPCDHDAHLSRYLRDVVGVHGWRIVDREVGATPIFRVAPARTTQRVIPIGVAAGLAKTPTGYALMPMLRHAERLATSLARRGHPRVRARTPPLSTVADRYFVDLLERDPSRLEGLLTALFTDAPADAALAFLDDRAPLGEQLAVARAVPGWLSWWLDREARVPRARTS